GNVGSVAPCCLVQPSSRQPARRGPRRLPFLKPCIAPVPWHCSTLMLCSQPEPPPSIRSRVTDASHFDYPGCCYHRPHWPTAGTPDRKSRAVHRSWLVGGAYSY